MAIKDYYPASRPTLDLNFAASGIVDPRLSFSRSGTGNIASYFDEKGVMNFAPPNVPRIDFDPITGECKGLLIEEQRTNLLTYSEQFNNDAVWIKNNSGNVLNTAIAPNGLLSADKIIENTAASAVHSFYILAPVVSGTTYSFSIYAKKGERNHLLFSAGNSAFNANQALFDINNGTVSSVIGATASISNVGNGWYRCVVILQAIYTATVSFNLYLYNGSTHIYTGDGVSGIYVWGAQLEQGAFPTSYIPTTSAQVTRAFDSASMTGANFSSWYKQDEGTLFADYILGADNSSLGVLYTYDGVTSNNNISMRYASAPLAQYSVNSNGINQVNITASGYSAPGKYKRAVAYAKDSFQQGINGVVQSSDTSGEVPLVTTLVIGAEDTAGSNSINGHICRIAYYPKRLSNINLQALTV